MNATVPTLLIVATVAFTPQSAAQKTNQPKEPVASARVPVDVSLQGLGVGLMGLPDCVARIAETLE